ncbi:MAG: thioredoxin domain-containing protein [Deltaproteobacteria bacterium]|nr:thioredoxin domain-containing protein [Deltaproteobacteria bacterium]
MKLAAALAIAAAIVLGSAPADAQRINFDPDVVYKVSADDAPSLGPKDALVTIVEFSDFYCGFCRRANSTLRKLMQLYPREVRLVYVHSPLDPEDGTLAAEASLAAAAQGQFWRMHDRIFAGPRGADRALLERYAVELGLDLARFKRDLDTRAHRRTLHKHIERGNRLGVQSTPLFFVNGRPVVGARNLGVFKKVVDRELQRARQVVKGGVARGRVYQATVSQGASRGTTDQIAPLPNPTIENGKRYRVGLGPSKHASGRDEALVTLVEFSDFECPYCLRAAPTVAMLKKKYGDELRVVYRHVPLDGHVHAQLAAEAAVEAQRQGKFWPFHDRILQKQHQLTRSDLETHARAVGLDMKAFQTALDRRTHMRTVLTDFADGAAMGVTGTPTFFINGVAMRGARPPAEFVLAIDAELAYAKTVVASGVKRKDLYAHIINSGDEPAAKVGIDTKGPIILDQGDYHMAVLIACRGGDAERAALFFKEIKDKRRRESIRADCKTLGVELE